MSAAPAPREWPLRRSGVRLWAVRLLGLLATAVLLGVGVYTLRMVADDLRGGDDEAATVGAPATEPAQEATGTHRKKAKPRYTAAQRRARSAAVAVLREQGYRPVRLGDYAPANALRVLIGRGEGGQRAFFFHRGAFLGNDAAEDSERLRVIRRDKRSATIAYKLWSAGDKPCCPSASARVRFRWNGSALEPQGTIPSLSARRAPAA